MVLYLWIHLTMDSTNHTLKIFGKNIVFSEYVHIFFLVVIPLKIQCNSCLHGIRYFKSSRGGWVGYMQIWGKGWTAPLHLRHTPRTLLWEPYLSCCFPSLLFSVCMLLSTRLTRYG
jgi:hypothetical protein